uniref:Uncharacterized protein n=1 Tax=Oryza brachyantha TaxID=4533 RepID=J3MD45_ORYBR
MAQSPCHINNSRIEDTIPKKAHRLHILCITFESQISGMSAEWSVGLFGCFGDCGTSCCMHGTLYVLLGTIGCQCLYSCTKRSSMRAQYNLQQSPCFDCCVHFFCESCALCQEYRELEKRGFNMAKGWEGSNKMVGCVQGMKPPGKQRMCF